MDDLSLIPNEQAAQSVKMPSEVPVTSDEIYANYLQEDRVKNIIQQISPDNQLLEIQWRIKGYIKNPLTDQWEKTAGNTSEPSPLLVSRFISYLSSILNQNTSLSNLSSGEINAIMRLVIEWLTDDLRSNAGKYGIWDDYSERTRIGHILLNTIFMVMKRSQNGREADRIFRALSVSENINPDQKKKGVLDFLKVWK